MVGKYQVRNAGGYQPPTKEKSSTHDKQVCLAAVPGLFESGGAIWEDGGERDAFAYCGTSWANVRKYDERVIAYERRAKRKKGAKHV